MTTNVNSVSNNATNEQAILVSLTSPFEYVEKATGEAKPFVALKKRVVCAEPLLAATRNNNIDSEAIYAATRGNNVDSEAMYAATRGNNVDSEAMYAATRGNNVDSEAMHAATRGNNVDSEPMYAATTGGNGQSPRSEFAGSVSGEMTFSFRELLAFDNKDKISLS